MKEIKMDMETYELELEISYDKGYEAGVEKILSSFEKEEFVNLIISTDFSNHASYSNERRMQNIIKKITKNVSLYEEKKDEQQP